MALLEVNVGSLQGLWADERTPLDQAIEALDCYLDENTVKGRNGHRAVLSSGSSALQIGSGGDLVQGLTRFRPTAGLVRTIAAVAGSIISVKDPTTEFSSDGTASTLGTPFGANAVVSFAQLGAYMYAATDEASANWQRITPGLALQAIATLPKGQKPTSSATGLSFVKFSSLAAGTLAGGAGSSALFTDWFKIDDGAGNPCPIGGNVTYNFGSDQDLTGVNWICVVVAAPTANNGGHGGKLDIALATAAGTFETLGQIYDTPNGGGSVNYVYFNLAAMTPATRAAARRIRITLTGAADYWATHGYMFLPSAPGFGPQQYRVTFRNSTTGQSSPPTDILEIQYRYDDVTIPLYHNVYADRATFVDGGNASLDPDAVNRVRCFNVGGGVPLPSRYEFTPVYSILGNIPTGDLYANADQVVLWRLTETGWRVVKTVTLTSSATTSYSIKDDQGSKTLTNEKWRPKGNPPQVNVMAAFFGRLVTGYSATVSISDYLPLRQDTEPFPQFTTIPELSTDGWSFRIGESDKEQIGAIVAGDGCYIMTNENCYLMPDVDPGTLPFKLLARGVVSRAGAIWCETGLFFASSDGVYHIQNRARPDELTKTVRRTYREWLVPDGNTVLAYQERKLYVVKGNRFLRYDFVNERWTRGTMSHKFLYTINFKDPAIAQSTFFLDLFNDAGGTDLAAHTPDKGAAWFAHPSNAVGRNYLITASGDRVGINLNNLLVVYYNNTLPPSPDVIWTLHMYYGDNANNDSAFFWRGSKVDLTNYSLQFQDTGTTIYLRRTIAGVPTVLATTTYATAGWGNPNPGSNKVQIVHIGNTIDVYINGALVPDLHYVDTDPAAISANGYMGFTNVFNRLDPNMKWLDVQGEQPGSVATNEQQMWFISDDRYLTKWQRDTVRDLQVDVQTTSGLPIPDWQYCTGYLFNDVPYNIDSFYLDATGPITLTIYRDSDGTDRRRFSVPAGEQIRAGSSDFVNNKHRFFLSGKNDAVVRRFRIDPELLDQGIGGGES